MHISETGSRGAGAGTAPENPATVEPVRILLVDDEVRNLEVLESILRSPEHDLVRALTPDQALMLLLSGDEYGVIVLDIQMPEMSGIELANFIKHRKRTRHIPIIFLTAHFQEDKDILVGYDSGAVDYLTKPINPQILRSKIAVFVDLFRMTRALAASNAALELEIAHRMSAEEELRRANNDLEARVDGRTADLRRANDELRDREVLLRAGEAKFKAAAHAKDEFLAALSHELRTPLNPVLLLASHGAVDTALAPAVRAQFETIRRNVELEARLIDDLLDLTRITRGMLRLERKPLDVHTVVRDAVSIVLAEAQEKGLEISLDLCAGEHLVFGDAVRIQQVFWNVLKNAVKFTPAGGRIRLESRASAENGEWTVRVTDTGIGLSDEELGLIFEAFVQGEHARRPGMGRYGGIGLGLAISRSLVEMHAGRIGALSDGRGKGSQFVVALPLLRPTAKPPEGPSSATAGPDQPGDPVERGQGPAEGRLGPCRGILVLIVEDHAATRSTLANLLDCQEVKVVATESANEALGVVARQRFDLVISDIGLPDGAGWDLLGELRAIQPGLRGIALSGYGMEEDVARSRRAGFAEHLVKPVGIKALNAAILSALGDGSVVERL